jgi:CRP-like cAMP-binding protein
MTSGGSARTARLKACPLFRTFTETGLQIFAAISTMKQLDKGATLFKAGDPSDGMYVIAEGTLAVMIKDPDGREVQMALLGPGDHAGSTALLGKNTRAATLVAHQEASLLFISREAFARLQGQKPAACVKLMSAVAQEMGKLLGEATEVRFAIEEAAVKRLRAG